MPGTLSVTDVNLTGMTLNWAPSTDNRSVLGYKLEIDGAVQPGVYPVSPLHLVGLTEGTTYSFRLAAVDGSGNQSAWSSSFGDTTLTQEAADFPRPLLGMYWIGGDSALGGFFNQYDSAQGIDAMSKRDVVIMNAWPELENQGGPNKQAVAAAVKAASTRGTEVYVYMDTERVYLASYTTNYATRRIKIEAENWYVYTSGSSGTPIGSYFGPTTGKAINPTIYVGDDTDGRNAMQWLADYEPTWIYGGAENNTAAPAIDGIFWDNTLLRPRQTADWDRNSSSDTSSNTTVGGWYMQGIATGVNRFKTNHPTKKALGNLAEFPNVGGSGWPASFAALTHYDGLFHGGVLEHICGRTFSAESFMTTAQYVAAIQGCEDACIDPNLLLFTACPDDFSSTNYRLMRHSLATCLVVSDTAFAWTRNTESMDKWDWYDEYDFNLGLPLETRRTSAESNGIWRRDFENGIVLWNPRGNTGTIALGGTFYRLRGSQDTTANSAASVTSVTFSTARDGLILSRTAT